MDDAWHFVQHTFASSLIDCDGGGGTNLPSPCCIRLVKAIVPNINRMLADAIRHQLIYTGTVCMNDIYIYFWHVHCFW